MSHVDEGTMHAYLDGELSPAEAQGVDAHIAQCAGCRERLDGERALIARADELLALAAPPDRELPPFRPSDVTPPTHLWWQVRLPLAWAATVVLALGIGTYLGSGVERVRKSETAADAEADTGRVLRAPVVTQRAEHESRARLRRAARTPPAAPPAAPAPAARNAADDIAQERAARVAVRAEASSALSAANQAPTPQPSVSGADRERYVRQGSPIGVDTARVLLGTDPLVVPGAPIRAIYRAREIGYSAVVIVEQALDSSTVIEVVNGRRSPLAVDQVVVTGAGAPVARPDSVSSAERAPLRRARVADSLAAAPAAKAAARPLRRLNNLEIQISGPLPSDSLQKLLQLVQPVKP